MRVLPRYRRAWPTLKLRNDVSLRLVRNVRLTLMYGRKASPGKGYRATSQLHRARHGERRCELGGIRRDSRASSHVDGQVGAPIPRAADPRSNRTGPIGLSPPRSRALNPRDSGLRVLAPVPL